MTKCQSSPTGIFFALFIPSRQRLLLVISSERSESRDLKNEILILAIYPKEMWDKQLERLALINPMDRVGLQYERYVMSVSISGNSIRYLERHRKKKKKNNK